jgi:site-specific DNA-methyltransferase (adenine-specific)
VLRWGTGGLNIDATRITVDPVTDAPQLRTMKRSQRTTDMSGQTWGLSKKDGDEPQVIRPEGRWPANVVLDEEAAAMLDAQSGERTSGYMKPGQQRRTTLGAGGYHGNMPDEATAAGTYGDSGGASRFFYCSKASRTERDAGLEDHNSHPTVKPVTLMRWLVRLVTPPGGTVLDPFCGSGTTLIAAVLEGMETIGIELVEEYCQTAMDRLRYWETQL